MVTCISYMDVGVFKHNYKGFCKKFTYLMSMNKGKMITTQGAHASLVRILSFIIFLSQRRDFKRRSNDSTIV